MRTSEAALVHGAEPLVVKRSRGGVKQRREELAHPWTFQYAKDLLGVGEVVLALHERHTSHPTSGRQDPLRGKVCCDGRGRWHNRGEEGRAKDGA